MRDELPQYGVLGNSEGMKRAGAVREPRPSSLPLAALEAIGSWYLRVASNLTLKVFACPYLTQRLYPPLQSLLLTQRFILHLGISSRILQSEGSVPSDHGSLMQRFTSPSSVCWFQALKKSACMVDASPDESVTLPAVVGM
jgi:hypothetical protein